jgi:hypothetical protein
MRIVKIVKRYNKLKNEAKLKAFLKTYIKDADRNNTKRSKPGSSSK